MKTIAKINIKGPIISTNQQWIYDWFGMEATSPKKVNQIIEKIKGKENLEIEINSGGGDISAASEIYTAIRNYKNGNKKINIVGNAHSAASVIAMAAECYMSPTAMMMIHKVSTGVSGNSDDMEKMSDVLKTADKTVANAYVEKTGMSIDEALLMMKETTWLTAQQAKEKGLIDGIMFEDESKQLVNSFSGMIPAEVIEKMQNERLESTKNKVQNKIKFLKLKGEQYEI